MKLEQLQDLTNTKMTDDDVLAACKALWDIREKETERQVRNAIGETLLQGKDLAIQEEWRTFLYDGIGIFRNRLNYQRTQVPAAGKDSMAKVEFLKTELGFTDISVLTPLIEKAAEEDSPVAIHLITIHKLLDGKLSAEERVKVAKEAIGKTGALSYDLLALAQNINGQKDDYRKTLEEGAAKGNTRCALFAAKGCEERGEIAEALRYYELARFDEDPEAAFLYAMTFIGKKFGRVDNEKCVDLLIKAAFSGSSEAAAHLGKSYLWGLMYAEGKKDFSKAEFYLTMADELGHSDAGYFLGCLYDGDYTGAEDLIDRKKAAELWEKLAKKGHADSLASVGDYYYHGYAGYKKSLVMAAACYFEASKRGSAKAATEYAEMIRDDETPGTGEEMIRQFCRGLSSWADSDREQAKRELAECYEKGLKIQKEPDWAKIITNMKIVWMGSQKATYQDVIDKMNNLRKEYWTTHKAPVDEEEMKGWEDCD
jgi:TPR repeat protein